MVGTQGMNRHWKATGFVGAGEDGVKNDDVYRNISHNDDVKFFDALIDDLVGTGLIDPARIYITGASNGCMFGSLYAIVRSGFTDGGALGRVAGETPKGNRVAAVSCFSGSDPFVGIGWHSKCHSVPYARSSVPVMVVSRLCDVIVCSWVKRWMRTLREKVGSRDARWIFLDSFDNRLTHLQCDHAFRAIHCPTPASDFAGHAMWPSAYTNTMLDFMLKYEAVAGPLKPTP